MTLRFFVFLLVIVIAFFSYLMFFNYESSVTIKLASDQVYHTSTVLLLLLSFLCGSVFILLTYLFKDSTRFFSQWKSRREEQKKKVALEFYNKATENLLRGDFEKATNLFIKAIERVPDSVQFYIKLFDLYFQNKNFDEAKRIIQKAALIDKDNPEILSRTVKVLEASGEIEKIEELLKAIIDEKPSNLRVLRLLRDSYMGAKNWEKAYEVQKTILKLNLQGSTLKQEEKILLGLKYQFSVVRRDEGDPDEAYKKLGEILEIDGSFVAAALTMAEIEMDKGEFEKGVARLEDGFRKTENPIFLTKIEELLIKYSQPVLLLESFDRITKEFPSNIIASFLLGKLYLRLEMVEEAQEQLEKVYSYSGGFQELFILLGETYWKRDNHSKALQFFNMALEFKKNLIIPFKCLSCDTEYNKFQSFCDGCNQWNTLFLSLMTSTETEQKSAASKGVVRFLL